jgi:hypothetical protein
VAGTELEATYSPITRRLGVLETVIIEGLQDGVIVEKDRGKYLVWDPNMRDDLGTAIWQAMTDQQRKHDEARKRIIAFAEGG